MSSHHHNSTHHVSRVDVPCLLYGTVGICLALAMQTVGLLKAGDDVMLGFLKVAVFQGQLPKELALPVQILFTAVFCYGLAFVVLDTAGTWRRVLIGGTVLVLVLSMVPTLAVWNIYFSPFLVVVGVFWTWFCTMMYVSHHLMPCEVSHAPASILTVSSAYKQPAVTEEIEEKKEGVKKPEKEPAKVKVQAKDPLKKYQPKELDKVQVKERANG